MDFVQLTAKTESMTEPYAAVTLAEANCNPRGLDYYHHGDVIELPTVADVKLYQDKNFKNAVFCVVNAWSEGVDYNDINAARGIRFYPSSLHKMAMEVTGKKDDRLVCGQMRRATCTAALDF